jgi:hypothetical protein
MNRLFLLLMMALPVAFSASGQQVTDTITRKQAIAPPPDTTSPSLLYQFYFARLDSLNNDALPMRYIIPNPYYYRLFTPLAFYYAPVRQMTDIPWTFRPLEAAADSRVALLPADTEAFTSIDRTNKQVNRVLMSTYLNHPEYVVTTEDRILSRKVFRKDIEVKASPETSVLSLFKAEPVGTSVGKAEVVIRKPNFWVTGGSGSLQLTQNYISGNWYKGGESSKSMLGYFQLFANYNDKEKVQFENMFEAKVGFMTAASDTIHSYKMNTDLLRLYSKLGLQAASNWYYTVSAEFNSQLFRNYKTNTNVVQSAFLAPANIILSVGMDYKQKRKNMNLSVFLSPLAYNLRYVGSDKVDETRFGLEKDKSALNDFGSKIQTTLSWTIIPSVVLNSRFYYFTNYKKVETEWENTLNFVLNRYLSTKLFIHARFDDNAKRVDNHSYFQLQELLSFGLNYKW